MPPGILASSPDLDPRKQEKCREKVTKLSWEDSEQARAFGSLQQSTSFQASTYHKNRKSQQKEKGSFLNVLGRKRSTQKLQAGWG